MMPQKGRKGAAIKMCPPIKIECYVGISIYNERPSFKFLLFSLSTIGISNKFPYLRKYYSYVLYNLERLFKRFNQTAVRRSLSVFLIICKGHTSFNARAVHKTRQREVTL